MKLGREPGWSELKVGLLAFAALILLALLVIKIERNKGIFARQSIVMAHLNDLKGLRIGSPVQFSGIEVGSIDDLEFQKDGSVVVQLAIKRDIRQFIKTSSTMSIETMGVLGDKFILVAAGSTEDPPLKDGDFLPLRTGSNVSDLMGDTSSTIVEARKLMENLNEILRGNGTVSKLGSDPKLYNDLQRAAESMAKLVEAVNARQGSLGKFVYDDKLYDKTDDLSKKLNILTEELTTLVKDIRQNPKRYFSVSVF